MIKFLQMQGFLEVCNNLISRSRVSSPKHANQFMPLCTLNTIRGKLLDTVKEFEMRGGLDKIQNFDFREKAWK